MWKWLAKRSMDAFERHYNYDAGYMRRLLEISPQGFRKFAKVVPLASCRRKAPPEVFYVAKIAAMRSEDCGPCLQLTVRMALESGVNPEILRTAVNDPDSLPTPLREVYDFAIQVAENRLQNDGLTERLTDRYGAEAMAELALGIAASRVFPTVKRALGFAKSCSLVRIEV